MQLQQLVSCFHKAGQNLNIVPSFFEHFSVIVHLITGLCSLQEIIFLHRKENWISSSDNPFIRQNVHKVIVEVATL